jgi:hypothetical protein
MLLKFRDRMPKRTDRRAIEFLFHVHINVLLFMKMLRLVFLDQLYTCNMNILYPQSFDKITIKYTVTN